MTWLASTVAFGIGQKFGGTHYRTLFITGIRNQVFSVDKVSFHTPGGLKNNDPPAQMGRNLASPAKVCPVEKGEKGGCFLQQTEVWVIDFLINSWYTDIKCYC
jgi:hypothetical protein